MLDKFRDWQRRRILERKPLEDSLWEEVLARFAFFDGLSGEERQRLRELATLFLHEKDIHGARGHEITDEMRVLIAAQAALLILNLDLGWYRGWVEVIVYPDEFLSDHEYTDEHGIVHRVREPRTGESWERGPLILASSDVECPDIDAGYNVVIHEFAHKLDMLDGASDGRPPLHSGISREDWAREFSAAYEDLCRRVESGEETAIDPYAGEGPDEFFAVSCEAFFLIPWVLQQAYPPVYEQLRAFFRQDPAARLPYRDAF
ncbi:MAG TPA: M90 family metallopeptidase [Burkholderiales bacterium]|nr:M90 family metallopeptidase [Burkholderiales bacterium]